jgi:hypothetical protein
MQIRMTLSEIKDKCDDWDYFCEQEGWSVYACAEGGGNITTTLDKEQVQEYGII